MADRYRADIPRAIRRQRTDLEISTPTFLWLLKRPAHDPSSVNPKRWLTYRHDLKKWPQTTASDSSLSRTIACGSSGKGAPINRQIANQEADEIEVDARIVAAS